jgi:hypothetical protein
MCVIKIHAFTSMGRPPSWSGTIPNWSKEKPTKLIYNITSRHHNRYIDIHTVCTNNRTNMRSNHTGRQICIYHVHMYKWHIKQSWHLTTNRQYRLAEWSIAKCRTQKIAQNLNATGYSIFGLASEFLPWWNIVGSVPLLLFGMGFISLFFPLVEDNNALKWVMCW